MVKKKNWRRKKGAMSDEEYYDWEVFLINKGIQHSIDHKDYVKVLCKEDWNDLPSWVAECIKDHNKTAISTHRKWREGCELMGKEALRQANQHTFINVSETVFKTLTKPTRDKIVQHNKDVRAYLVEQKAMAEQNESEGLDEELKKALRKNKKINFSAEKWKALSEIQRDQIRVHNRDIVWK